MRYEMMFPEQIRKAVQDKELVKYDPCLGYHPEAHTHLFTLKDLDYKIFLLKSNIQKISRMVKK
ncbi:MAG: hypothetical protein DDT40_01160 [candidate division WS2 bacterium]|nr:hypothetical protein [Candidatus Psychracetigena formicireducens]